MADLNYRYFEFGDFRLDVQRRVLHRDGAAVHLTPRSFDLLQVMVENPGRVLEHDELLDQVWAGTFVEQGNLKKTISALRNALGEAPGSGEFVTTVPRRGYRFSAPVRRLRDDPVLIRETKTEILVEEEIEDQPQSAHPWPDRDPMSRHRPYSRRIVWVAGTVLILTIVALAGWMLWRGNPQRISMDNAKFTRVISDGNINGGTLSPNSDLYTYTANQGNEQSLWVRQVANGSEVRIQGPAQASFWYATFSPDNSYVYYSFYNRVDPERNGVYRVGALGGVPQLLVREIFHGLKFSPDGKRVAAYRTVNQGADEIHQLVTIDPLGRDEHLVLALPRFSLFRGIAWSPDGSTLLYGVKKQTTVDKPIHYIGEIAAAGGDERIVLPDQEKVLYVEAWMPDHGSILLRQREPHSEIYQLWQYFPRAGELVRLTHDDYSYQSLTVSADGKTLSAFRGFALNSIWEADDANGEFRQLITGPNSSFALDWTREGQIVFATTENEREFVGIMNHDGSQKRHLTGGDDGINLNPRVAGDGRHLIFISNRSGSRQVWRIDLDGRNLIQLTSHPTGVGEAKLLTDGKTVLHSTYLPKTSIWYLVKQSGEGQMVNVTDTDTHDWDISPDEKLLVIQISDDRTQPKHLEVREIQTGRLVKNLAVENVSGLRWSRDGKELAFLRVRGDASEVVALDWNSGAERVLTAVRGERLSSFDWSQDGKRMALVRSKLQNEAVLLRHR